MYLERRILKILLIFSVSLFLRLDVSATTDGRECKVNGNLTRFNVLPGTGWDNLRNIELLRVLNINFSECQKSLDGRFFIPNYLELIPTLRTNMELFSEVFESYQTYTSLTASTINLEGQGTFPNGVTLGGSFSAEHQEVRTNQINSKSITTRVQLRQHLYTALAGQGMGLTRQFRDRLLDIGYQIRSEDSVQADYLADLLVADYGTHVITRVDAGGILWQLDSFLANSRDLSSKTLTQISAGASAGFKMVFNMKLGISHKTSDEYTNGYRKNLTHQRVGSTGGMPMKPGLNATQWSDSVEKNLVTIDRAGDAIFNVISSNYLGETLPYQMIAKIRDRVKSAVLRYNRANAIKGCMEPGSKNFDPQANIPIDDCSSERNNFTLGGFFQACQGSKELCKGHRINNIMTNSQSCPYGYHPVELTSRAFKCDFYCTGGLWWTKCHDNCAKYTLFWCAAKSQGLPPSSGYLFGGIYTHRASNPITGQKTCPPTFISFHFGTGDITVCLSRDIEMSQQYQINFGGMFSCNAGNPYTVLPPKQSKRQTNLKESSKITLRSSLLKSGANQWPRTCPRGYSQHLGFIDATCEMMFCMKSGTLKRIVNQQVQKPPFVVLPEGSIPRPRPEQTLKLSANGGEWRFDNQDMSWHYSETSRLKKTVAVLGTLFGTMCVGLLIAILIFAKRRYSSRRVTEEYQQLQSGPIETATPHQPV